MTLDLCASTRDWIARSPSRHEVQDFADWLKAQHYTDFVCDRHLRRLCLLELRGPSRSSRIHHAQEVADFLIRELRPRQQLR
jgi:hypothetical protein